jgi:hypothetical protein
MSELRRVSKDGAEIWLSCPDMEKVCRGYITDRGQSLLEGRMRRWPSFSLHGKPVQHIINDLFHQDGEHVNLFDFEYLEWLLTSTGFRDVHRVSETAFRARFPEFRVRGDDDSSVYVRATARA